jgi:hypothetical protein
MPRKGACAKSETAKAKLTDLARLESDCPILHDNSPGEWVLVVVFVHSIRPMSIYIRTQTP